MDQIPANSEDSAHGIKRTADEAEIPKSRQEADNNGEVVQETYEVEDEGDPDDDEDDEEEEDKVLSAVGLPMKPAPLKLLGNNVVEQEDTVK